MINNDTLELVKAKMNIVDVVGDFLKLKRQGPNMIALCPFHNEKTGSFTVSPAKQIFKCFGCGNSGDAIQFLMEHEKKSFIDAISWIAQKYNIEIENSGKPKAYVKPIPRLEKLDKKKLDWFEKERMISNNTLLRLQITESKEFMPQLNSEAPVMCFPYYRGEELINIKFRGPKKSFRLSKDAELIFYNLNATKGEKECVIVEGEIDTATLMECGIYNVIGVPNGTPPKGTKMNLEYLDNCWQEISRMQSVIIAVDNDEVGSHLKEELARRIGKQKCKTVTYPDGCKDPNEILCKLGKEAVVEFIESAKQWPMEGVVTMDDMYLTIEDYYENGYPPGLKSGVPGLDDMLTFGPGLMTVVTGMPGHGKDEYLNDIMVGLARDEGAVFAIVDFEDDPPIHTTKLMEKITKKAFDFRKDPNHRMSRMEKDYAISVVDKHFVFINVSKINVSISGIISKLEEVVLRYGVNVVKINPWNYLEHNRNGKSETDYTSEELTKFASFLKQYSVHGFLFAHPTKMQKDKSTGMMERPNLYHISGSSHFFNKTHNGISVYLDYSRMVTEVHIQKVKYYWHGHKGCITYSYNTNTRQYGYLSTEILGVKPEAKAPPELGEGNWKAIPDPNKFIEPLNSTDENNEESEIDPLPF